MTLPLESALVGHSAVMLELRAMIERAAAADLPVVVEGPTGSGKELVAQALHTLSGRRGNLVPVNVCAVSESMFEDALFGHARGAFTGAVNERAGFLREADGGTIFLDEIGGLPLALQAKLLRALETGRFRPVGGAHDVETRARVVAATNEPIAELVRAQRFRADLAHRLMAAVIRVPCLDERRADIPALVRHFLDAAGREDRLVAASAIEVLCERDWPGNVRELKQVVLWAATLCDGTISDRAVNLAMMYRATSPMTRTDGDHAERRELRRVLECHDWDGDAVAGNLGIHRATVYRRMKRLDICAPPARSRAESQRVARQDATRRDSSDDVISINSYRATG